LQTYRYYCLSKTGGCQEGRGTTFMELGSVEQTQDLLNQISEIVHQVGLPWDPFNLKLFVWAQPEPKHFYKPSDL
jgi:hypothetical protein